jgi:hypothetical protein
VWRWLTDCAADEDRRRQLLSYTFGFGFAVACFFFAWVLHGSSASSYRIGSEWSAFAGLFILALAIERALEPFSRKLGPDSTERKKAGDRAEVETCRRLTAVVTWGVATGLAFLLCAQLNITLLQAVRANGSGQPPFWADLLVTGLVVGAGTKPLHDLVSNSSSPSRTSITSTGSLRSAAGPNIRTFSVTGSFLSAAAGGVPQARHPAR